MTAKKSRLVRVIAYLEPEDAAVVKAAAKLDRRSVSKWAGIVLRRAAGLPVAATARPAEREGG